VCLPIVSLSLSPLHSSWKNCILIHLFLTESDRNDEKKQFFNLISSVRKKEAAAAAKKSLEASKQVEKIFIL
jgi:hypothetical protein